MSAGSAAPRGSEHIAHYSEYPCCPSFLRPARVPSATRPHLRRDDSNETRTPQIIGGCGRPQERCRVFAFALARRMSHAHASGMRCVSCLHADHCVRRKLLQVRVHRPRDERRRLEEERQEPAAHAPQIQTAKRLVQVGGQSVQRLHTRLLSRMRSGPPGGCALKCAAGSGQCCRCGAG